MRTHNGAPHGVLCLGADRGYLLDWLTQQWVRRTGRRVSLREHPWLDGPTGDPALVADRWITTYARRVEATVHADDPDAGLLPSMEALEGEGFRVADLHPEIVEFYEHTARFRLDVWSRWSGLFRPFGWLISALFARRLQQLNLPLDPLAVSRGMTSAVIQGVGQDGEVLGTAWQRTLRATGDTVFGGWYGTVQLPARARRSIRVVFPLPNGSITVLLRPDVLPDGSLRLVSSSGRFGEEGAYLVVRPGGGADAWARRAPLPETFRVYVDDDGLLRADHELRLRGAEVMRLHYRLERASEA